MEFVALNSKNNAFKMTGRGSVIGLTVLFLLSFLTFLFLSIGDLILVIPCFSATIGMLAFMLLGQRYLSLVIPCIAAVVCVNNIIPAAGCLACIYLCSLLFSVTVRGGVESFSFFVLSTVAYAVVFGAVYVLSAVNAYGSFAAGMETLRTTLIAQATEMLGDSPQQYKDLVLSAMETAVYLIPAIVCWIGATAALITSAVMKRAAGGVSAAGALFTRITRAPALLGFVYIFFLIFGAILFGSSEGSYYAVLNLTAVLSFVFMIEGFKEFGAVMSSPGGSVKKVVLIAATVMLIMYLTSGVVIIAALFGASRITTRRVREALERSVKDDDDRYQ